MTRPLLDEAAATLRAAGVASPRVDAELLLSHALRIPRALIIIVDEVNPEAQLAFRDLIARRVAREPLQHIVGTAPFRYVEVAVGPGVFVPRPETELLVDAVLPALRDLAAPTVVDLCAGSGALALALCDEVPAARVYAVERSSDSLVWLRRNAAGSSVEVVAADIAAPGLLAELDGRVDAVVSNPPYVPTAVAVGPEVAHDPTEAVFAGADGLALMPAVIAAAARLLRPEGVLAVEHDETHQHAVPDLLQATGDWHDIADHTDLAGRPRYVTATRRQVS